MSGNQADDALNRVSDRPEQTALIRRFAPIYAPCLPVSASASQFHYDYVITRRGVSPGRTGSSSCYAIT